MKPATVVLSLILILMLAFGAFFYTGGTLQAQVSSIAADASEHSDAFESIKAVLASGSAPQLFSSDIPSSASGYSLVDVSITLTNRGIFDAEWLNVQLKGTEGDIAVYSLTGDGTDVAARSSGMVNLKFITRAPADRARSISIQYYVYGISRTIEIPL